MRIKRDYLGSEFIDLMSVTKADLYSLLSNSYSMNSSVWSTLYKNNVRYSGVIIGDCFLIKETVIKLRG